MANETSQRKIEANRRNALKSTGLRTPEGKRAVRYNALKHGLLAKEVIIELKEDRAEFDEFFSRLHEDLQPVGMLEEMLVEKIAVDWWRLRRVLRSEAGEICAGLVRPSDTMERQLGRYLRKKSEREREAEHIGRSLPSTDASNKILRYGTALNRELYRALSELERLQRRRRGDTVPPPIKVDVSTDS